MISIFHIVNIPFIFSYIPAAPAYGVHISQMIGIARACSFYNYFLELVVNIESFAVASMTWLRSYEYDPFGVITTRSCPHSRLVTGFVACNVMGVTCGSGAACI